MANGSKGDHRFSPTVDALIAEIIRLGGQKELERDFDLLEPPPLDKFEPLLQQMRDRLRKEAKERGWEV